MKDMKASRSNNSCFEILKQVGIEGKYQTLILIFSCFLAFQNGIISLGTPYFFAIAPYSNCPSPYQGSACNKYVCSLPAEQRSKYLQGQIAQLKTIGNQFGDYHCQKSGIVGLAKGMPYFGAIAGPIITGIFSDNFGRKNALYFSLVACIFGHLLMLFAKSLVIASIGLFFTGFGVESCCILSMILVSQTLENIKRQKAIILVQVIFCASGLFMILAFYLIKSWKPIFICFGLIPLIIGLIFNFYFVRETPLFLIKQCSVAQIRQNLRFIAEINQKAENFDTNQKLSQSYIQKLKTEYQSQLNQSHSTYFSCMDLFRFSSIRKTSICFGIIFTSLSFLYYAPVMLVNQFGFDFYFNGVLVNCSQLVTYLYTYLYIQQMERRKSCLMYLLGTLICAFGLVFTQTKQICTNNCFSTKILLELLLLAIMRFCVSLEFQLAITHTLELYPMQVLSIAMGLMTLLGSLGPTIVNLVINWFNNNNISIMLLFMLLACIAFTATLPLEETFGVQPRQRIKEMECFEEDNNLEVIQQCK